MRVRKDTGERVRFAEVRPETPFIEVTCTFHFKEQVFKIVCKTQLHLANISG